MLDINFFGATRGVYHFAPRMIAAGTPGAIVTRPRWQLSVRARTWVPTLQANMPTFGMSESLLQDLQSHGVPITVSLLCLGLVKAGITTDKLSAEDRDMYWKDATRAALVQKIERGIAPDTVTAMAFDGAAAGRFWIFIHPEHLAGARKRLETMVGTGFIE